ncbi:MAG: 3-hydroxyacyl-CoA dehydrogenase [Thermoplasmatota archaeon]
MDVRTVAVLGAGDMGHGIAELAAVRGYDVRLRDVKPEILEGARERMAKSLAKLAERGTIPADAVASTLARIRLTTDLVEAVTGADLVIEAVPERLDLKQGVFAEVEKTAPTGAILASNTSTMRMADVGARLRDPSRFIGLHFFNPVLVMQLVEIIPHAKTSEATLATAKTLTQALGKKAVVCHRDLPGFITSRLVGAWIGAACRLLEAKAASPPVVDAAMKRAGFPMGPFELADYTGIDISVHAANYIASKLGEAYAPLAPLSALASAGHLGKKTGEGFYRWTDGRLAGPAHPYTGWPETFDAALLQSAIANEAAKLLSEGAGTPDEIDRAMQLGCAFPVGPLRWADGRGLTQVVEDLGALDRVAPHPMFRPAAELAKRARDRGTFYAH